MDLSDDSYSFWVAILSARPRHVRFSLQCSMKIDDTEVVLTVPLAWILFTTSFSLFFFTTKGSVSEYIFQYFILQLPLTFKNGNSPCIPRIQARMQWFLCPLSENSLQHFKNGEIDAKMHGEIL